MRRRRGGGGVKSSEEKEITRSVPRSRGGVGWGVKYNAVLSYHSSNLEW